MKYKTEIICGIGVLLVVLGTLVLSFWAAFNLYLKYKNMAQIIHSKEYPNGLVNPRQFLKRGEYDQGDFALIGYDDLYDYIKELK